MAAPCGGKACGPDRTVCRRAFVFGSSKVRPKRAATNTLTELIGMMIAAASGLTYPKAAADAKTAL